MKTDLPEKSHGSHVASLSFKVRRKQRPQNLFLKWLREIRFALQPHELARNWGEISLKLHLDIGLRLLLLAALIALTSFLYYHSTAPESQRVYDLFQTIAVVIALAGLLSTAIDTHHQYHHNKLAKASTYVERWYSQEFAPYISIVRMIKSDVAGEDEIAKDEGFKCFLDSYAAADQMRQRVYDWLVNDLDQMNNHSDAKEKRRKQREDVNRFLHFFEHMGQDVHSNVADERYLKDFFYYVVVNYYFLFSKYIEHIQTKRSPKTFCYFENLANTWRDSRKEPSLPRNCGLETQSYS